jgi:hypothetical protein
MEETISLKAAENEVSNWLDSLDILPERREDMFVKAVIANIVRAVQKGLWIFNENGTITQNLKFPLGEKGVTSSLTYTNRYKIGDWHKRKQKIAHGDATGEIIAKLSLMSGQPAAVIESLENPDYEVATNVAVFF